jgi:hypothetical protein
MHNHHEEIETTFRVIFDDPHYIEAFIWKDTESMRRLVPGCEDCYAYATSGIYNLAYKSEDEQIVQVPRKFGEVHLVINNFGVGVVAHELQHVLLNYAFALKIDLFGDGQEQFCKIVQNANNKFWTEFYDRYTQVDLNQVPQESEA